jgi:WD40 repeat protein
MLRSSFVLLVCLAFPGPLFAQAKKLDDYGGPLPDGALRRFGTVRLRYGNAAGILLPPGDRTIIALGYKACRIFDAQTGATLRSAELPSGRDPKQSIFAFGETTVLMPDGGKVIDLLPGGDVIRDFETGQVEKRLTIAKRSAIQRLSHAFTPDGRYLAIAGRPAKDNIDPKQPTVIRYDLTTGQGKWLANRVDFDGQDVAITPDGARLLLYKERKIVGWDVAGDRKLWSMVLPTDLVLIHPHGKTFLTLGFPADLTLRRLETGALLLAKVPEVSGVITALAWSPDGRTLAVASDSQVLLWDMDQGAITRRLPTGADHMAFSEDGRSLVTLRGVLQSWDLATGKPRFPRSDEDGHTDPVRNLLWSRDGKSLVTASLAEDQGRRGKDASPRDYVFRWDTATGRPAARFEGPVPGVVALGKTAAGQVLAVTADRAARTWDAGSGKLVRTVKLIEPSYQTHGNMRRLLQGRILPGGTKTLLYAAWETKAVYREKAAAWDLDSGRPFPGAGAERKERVDTGFPHFAWSIAGLGQDRFEGFHDRRLPPLEVPRGFAIGARFEVQDDRDLLLLGTRRAGETFEGKGGGLGLWETATGRLIKHVPFQRIFEHALSRDGRIAAFFSHGKLYLYDLVHEKTLASWDVPAWHGWPAFSPDGKLLATGMEDGSILLWPVPDTAPSHTPCSKAELEKAWNDLVDGDAAQAWKAIWRLADRPDDALSLLKEKVQPAPPLTPERVAEWIAALDADSFAKREEAAKRLIELGLFGQAAVLKAMANPPTLERKRRLQTILASYDSLPAPRGDRLRGLRAVAVLERIGNAEARKLLERYAAGDDMQYPTREARAALRRLQ